MCEPGQQSGCSNGRFYICGADKEGKNVWVGGVCCLNGCKNENNAMGYGFLPTSPAPTGEMYYRRTK